MSAALTLSGIRVGIGSHEVLRGLNLELAPHEIRALVGLNGAGKTTALRVALGMMRPDAGHVLLHGQDIWPSRPAMWQSVGHLVERPAAYPELTARDNIAHTALLHGADSRRCAQRAEQLAQALGMKAQLDQRVGRLSLGTRQKVGLICALAHQPAVVILDEPTNGLDPLAVVAFRDELRRLAEMGSSILITSHHFDELARVSHAVDVLHRGHIVATVTPDQRDLEKVFFDIIVKADHHDQDIP
ncbi:MAG: ABC transporter ATP-binding protein [Dermatophilaceae bacterium]